jgi:hypothetical protein
MGIIIGPLDASVKAGVVLVAEGSGPDGAEFRDDADEK